MRLLKVWCSIVLFALPVALAARAKFHDIPFYVLEGNDLKVDQAIRDHVDVNEPNSEGQLGLAAAVANHNLDIAHLLLAYRADTSQVEPATKDSAMVIAFQLGDAKMAHLLMMYGGNPDAPDGRGITARSLAAPNTTLARYIDVYDTEGPAGFEDPPGHWQTHVAAEYNDAIYYYSPEDGSSTYNKPVSCAWYRARSGHAPLYFNHITHQYLWIKPDALAWRRMIHEDASVTWFNYRTGKSVAWTPIEIPEDMLPEYIEETGEFWYNTVTEDYSWENPEEITWKEAIDQESGERYWFHTKHKISQWERPEDLSWTEHHSHEHNQSFYYNQMKGEKKWEMPSILAWVKGKIPHPDEVSEEL